MKLKLLLTVCLGALHVYTGCKKEEEAVVLFPVSMSDTSIMFSNITSDTAFLDFALVRISAARTTAGRLNDGFVLDTATSPVALLPGTETAVEKRAFVYKTDTLRNADMVINIGYNVRYIAVGDSVRRVKTFSKTF
jgi:hypothetical protein